MDLTPSYCRGSHAQPAVRGLCTWFIASNLEFGRHRVSYSIPIFDGSPPPPWLAAR